MARMRDGARRAPKVVDEQAGTRTPRLAAAIGLAAALFAAPAVALDVDALWVYGRPELSEQRFRAALADATPDHRLILTTQIARSHGLRKDFEKVRQILSTVRSALATASPEAQARFHLEWGRSVASAAHPPAQLTEDDRQCARLSYQRAFGIALQAGLDALAIDAMHMLAVIEPDLARQTEWNQRALMLALRSQQPAARRWEGALRNNVGHALRQQGRHDAAIDEFRLSREAYERDGRVRNVRIADWMIARTMRDQKRHVEALEIQHRLEAAWEADGRPDRYVFEELEHLYRAVGAEPRAQAYRRMIEATR